MLQKVIKSPEILLKLLDENELDIFTNRSFAERTQLHLADWMPQLRTLIKNGLVYIIERGKYCRHNFRNEYVISNYLAEDGIIAYWTALNLHGLTEQFPNTIFVQTTMQKKPVTVFGVSYKFIKVKSAKMTGIEKQGYGNNQFHITNKEKTIVDCFDLPEYSGGFEELIRAFVNTELNVEKLTAYCEAVNNISAIKRMGYLVELLKKENFEDFTAYALTKVNERYSLFDASGKNEGTHINRWKLRLNVGEKNILAIANNLY
jgi:predicted transcriptional regulator of viral defense system